jgi:hypothetical protein
MGNNSSRPTVTDSTTYFLYGKQVSETQFREWEMKQREMKEKREKNWERQRQMEERGWENWREWEMKERDGCPWGYWGEECTRVNTKDGMGSVCVPSCQRYEAKYESLCAPGFSKQLVDATIDGVNIRPIEVCKKLSTPGIQKVGYPVMNEKLTTINEKLPTINETLPNRQFGENISTDGLITTGNTEKFDNIENIENFDMEDVRNTCYNACGKINLMNILVVVIILILLYLIFKKK